MKERMLRFYRVRGTGDLCEAEVVHALAARRKDHCRDSWLLVPLDPTFHDLGEGGSERLHSLPEAIERSFGGKKGMETELEGVDKFRGYNSLVLLQSHGRTLKVGYTALLVLRCILDMRLPLSGHRAASDRVSHAATRDTIKLANSSACADRWA